MALTLRFCALMLASLALTACSRAPPSAVAGSTSRAALGPIHALASPVGANGGEPRLSRDATGSLILSWAEPVGDAGDFALKYARLTGDDWTGTAVVAQGRDWVISAADLPSVQALSQRLWVADWRVQSPASAAAYDIRVAVSADAGATWSVPLLLNDDATASEHGFVSWFRDGERAGAVWLDGRDEANDEPESAAGEPAGTSLRYAFLGANGQLLEQGVIDNLVCDCCRTDVALTAEGAAVVYRDRSATEIRDVAVRVRTSSGWSEPARLGPDNWQIAGCPVNGPALDAKDNGVVAAWFTAADGHGHVRFARSSDGGASFAAPVEIDGDGAFGQVGVVLTDDGRAFVSWWRRAADGRAELAVRAVARNGDLGERQVVGTTHASRPDTVPQMKRSGQRVVFVWTEDNDTGQSVKTAYADLIEGG
ncbi:MAG: hypothetical protein ABI640_03120 [Gammaproteobacteria bacterium]